MRCGLCVLVGLAGLVAWAHFGQVQAEEVPSMVLPLEAPAASVAWLTDYVEAHQLAKAQGKMLFLLFEDPHPNAAAAAFATTMLPSVLNDARRQRYVWCRLTTDFTVSVDDQQVRLLDHAAFAEMHGHSGVAIIDYENPDADYYGYVVSQFPFLRGRTYSARSLAVILDLPPGTLTQRTMIYAVRVHPDGPRSSHGQPHKALLREAENHSNYQARLGVQGHHHWETRFHRINARLGGGLLAQEVVAESWGGEPLVEAAIECVHSWRQSSGHWSAVRRYQPAWGYDIKRGANGVWYATGIFGNHGS
jgi:hypothetical protein